MSVESIFSMLKITTAIMREKKHLADEGTNGSRDSINYVIELSRP